ncbi:hypothetical protein [Sphingobacterium suaedae]|uniref:Uncharacterized protein n=1 Tax=Sphingobacterium suaedae TaxID=1686402 RepID=A0ABW5KHD2_9SPHI
MLMYNAVIPDFDNGSSDGVTSTSTSKSDKVGGYISLFDVGQRIMEGKGV